MLTLFHQVDFLLFKRFIMTGKSIKSFAYITSRYFIFFRATAANQAQNLQQAQMPMSPQPGQTGRGASVVKYFLLSCSCLKINYLRQAEHTQSTSSSNLFRATCVCECINCLTRLTDINVNHAEILSLPLPHAACV
jgi:hypothetical protein